MKYVVSFLLLIGALAFVASVRKGGNDYDSCADIKNAAICQNSIANDSVCDWCQSMAVPSACYADEIAHSLPQTVFRCNFTHPVKCNDKKTTDSCHAYKEVDGMSCSWCVAKAVPSACYRQDDAEKLPHSIFVCS
eukprot:TRINITY_DN5323_c0_g1_i1.p1 TRINITY_DN5323_c0_g1~~TRINITY_DN5323_c0_g1_i1.p1  ORF type:complete len:143 (+),score=17.22 TRINITY_DN5323_c0_g1_i1:25-429(+)